MIVDVIAVLMALGALGVGAWNWLRLDEIERELNEIKAALDSAAQARRQARRKGPTT